MALEDEMEHQKIRFEVHGKTPKHTSKRFKLTSFFIIVNLKYDFK